MFLKNYPPGGKWVVKSRKHFIPTLRLVWKTLTANVSTKAILSRNTAVIVGALIIAQSLFALSVSGQHSIIKVDQERLNLQLQELAKYGKDPAGGTSRVAYSEADLQGRAYVMALMQQAGLVVSIDYAGNIIGRRSGADPRKKPIAFGSHIDTVPNGGDYDGCVGSISAIEVIQTLEERNITTDHPLEVILFSNEEGGVVGSRAMIGVLKPEGLQVVNRSGLSVQEGMDAIGGDFAKLQNAVKSKGDYAAFLELHIEQGAMLDQADLDIGIVEGIVGFEVWNVTVEGFANHAGTTPMNMRQDALLAASELIIAINQEITSTEGTQVGTVGMIKAAPGAPNVIPGKVDFTLEIRDLSKEKIWRLFAAIQKRAASIETTSRTKIAFSSMGISGTPALSDERIKEAILTNAERLHLSYRPMPSGAGHDAQEMAQIAPIGMIFVPSVGGISHSPKEFTHPKDIANGANVLLNTILELDRVLN